MIIALCRSASTPFSLILEVLLQSTFYSFFFTYGVAAGYDEFAFQAIFI